MDDQDTRERVARIEILLEEVETLADPAARATATELVQALLELYGEGLARVVTHVAAGDDGELAEALADDELVAHLLLLHGLHPVPLERRVREALEGVSPYLESHGGGVELLGVEQGVVRLRLQGSCSGCPSSTATLKLAIEDAIHRAAPDVERVEADGVAPAAPSPLLQLEFAGGAGPKPAPATGPDDSWAMAGGMPELRGGGHVLRDVAGEPVLFIAMDESFYAYRPVCPGCDGSLADAAVADAELACPSCGRHYDVRRAGRCADTPELHLQPVPLLVDDAGMVKVAMGAVT
ncbi:MAG: nitrogen-fixing NifU domain protein [Solirubrobacterales bacterium]|nr:nitrogen-fixing NifU domain protein [Solirubrobacterales bacterium]